MDQKVSCCEISKAAAKESPGTAIRKACGGLARDRYRSRRLSAVMWTKPSPSFVHQPSAPGRSARPKMGSSMNQSGNATLRTRRPISHIAIPSSKQPPSNTALAFQLAFLAAKLLPSLVSLGAVIRQRQSCRRASRAGSDTSARRAHGTPIRCSPAPSADRRRQDRAGVSCLRPRSTSRGSISHRKKRRNTSD